MKKKNLIRLQDITFGMIAVSSLFLLVGASGANAATSAVDEVTITVPASCSLTNTVGSPHTTTIETGVYQDDIGETTFKVFCNDNEGFAVYAVGYTNDEFGNTTMKPSTLAVSNAITTGTGTATSGNTSNWAMKLTAVSGDYAPTLETGFNDYHVIPDTYTKVATYASNTDSSTGSSFKSTYGAFISQTQPADSYTGKVKYTVVHPASASAPAETISQITYMQDFKNMTSEQIASVMNSMSYHYTYNLIDNRDNKTYKIVKLKDGNIWMAENLDLGRTALTEDLTKNNTNLETTIASESFNGWKNTSGAFSSAYDTFEYYSEDGNDSASGAPYGTVYNYGAASAGTITGSTNSRSAEYDLCPAGWRMPTSGAFHYLTYYYGPDQKLVSTIASGGAAFALVGQVNPGGPSMQNTNGFYWTSSFGNASSNGYFFVSPSSFYSNSALSRFYGSAVRCIVKKPTHALTVSYGTNVSDIMVDGVSVQDGATIRLEEGVSYSISASIASTPGLYSSWSVASGTIDFINASTILYTAGNSDVTLTANEVMATEMQNLSSNDCTTTASRVWDNRDNHFYLIQRLADGNCWMMENLDLGRTTLTIDLTSSNTNITSTISKSTFNSWKKNSGSSTKTSGEYISINGTDPTSRTQYGTLYNYCATSAGSICTDSNSIDATKDICPAGWRLPTGGYSGEQKTLFNLTEYNTADKLRAPIEDGGAAFALAGWFYSDPGGQGSYGYYWSSTACNSTEMFSLYVNQTAPHATRSHSRYGGASIRCVLK